MEGVFQEYSTLEGVHIAQTGLIIASATTEHTLKVGYLKCIKGSYPFEISLQESPHSFYKVGEGRVTELLRTINTEK